MIPPLLTTRDVARDLAVSDEWVREHAAELGAIRVGDGPRGPLRFERRRIDEAMERRRLQDVVATRSSRRPGPPRRVEGGVELLPLPETR